MFEQNHPWCKSSFYVFLARKKKEIEPKSTGGDCNFSWNECRTLGACTDASHCHVDTVPFISFIRDIMGSLCFIAFDCNAFMAGTPLFSSVSKQNIINHV